MRSLRSFRRVPAGALIACCPAFVVVTPVRAQDAQQSLFDSTAAEMIRTMRKTPDTQILVCDFAGPKGLTELGLKLADDFNESLLRVGAPSLETTDRSRLLPLLHEVGIEREAAASEQIEGVVAAERLGADDFVSGDISVQNDQITLKLELHRVGVFDAVQKLKLSMSLDDGMKRLLVAEIHDTPQSSDPIAGTNGYSMPRCLACPVAGYTDAASKKKIMGLVLLMVTIGADGKVLDVRVLKELPDGLTENSVAAVKGWRFAPAKDATGRPAAIRTVVQVSFHLS